MPNTSLQFLFAALCGTAEGGEHLFLYLLLQTGRDSGDITEVQHQVVNLTQRCCFFFPFSCAVSGMPLDSAN